MILRKMLGLAAVVCMCAAAGAKAASTFLAIDSGAWNDSANWLRISGSSPQMYPTASDTAIISGVTINVDGGSSATGILYLANGGDLNVTSGDTLTIASGYIGHQDSTIDVDGTFVLNGSLLIIAGEVVVDSGGTFSCNGAISARGGRLVVNSGGSAVFNGAGFDIDSVFEINGGAVEVNSGAINVSAGGTLRMNGGRLQIDIADGVRLATETSRFEINADSAIGGSGSLRGDHVDAAVALAVKDATDVGLTIETGVTIHGTLSIRKEPYGTGLATLINEGQIAADVIGHMILLDASLDEIRDGGGSCASPNWWVKPGARLEFDRSATALSGAFRLDGNVYVSSGSTVTTTGNRRLTGTGSITGSFNYGANCP